MSRQTIVVAVSFLRSSFLNRPRPCKASKSHNGCLAKAGLNAGILPSPGFTYANITINYSSGAFNDPNGSAIPVTGRLRRLGS